MFVCSKCDAQFPKWTGRCDVCQSWGTVKEEENAPVQPKTAPKAAAAPSARLSDNAATPAGRVASGDGELDRVLGGGLVEGSLALLSGEPGIGKSTLVAQIASSLARSAGGVLYISGEESAAQLAGRFNRLRKPFEHVRYLEALPVETLVATIEQEQPALAIVDSIQTMTASALDAGAGSPNVVRYASNLFLACAKRSGIPVLIVGQITKDGSVAGPKTLEHLVDVVLSLEGDPLHAFRILRATKNRFGSTDEVGVFEMATEGLVAVANPSERFLAERAAVPGSVITAAVEGSRVFLLEVQALVEHSAYAVPVRRASGFDQNRLQMLCAILSKRARVKLADKDVYVNVIGGMRLSEPAADLAVCAAILSADKNSAVSEPTVYLGEVGLGGEVRSVPLCDRRLAEIERLGLKRVVAPKRNKAKGKTSALVVRGIETLADLLE